MLQINLNNLHCDGDGDIFEGSVHLLMPSVGTGSMLAPEASKAIVRACNAHDDLVEAVEAVLNRMGRLASLSPSQVRKLEQQLQDALAKAEGK